MKSGSYVALGLDKALVSSALQEHVEAADIHLVPDYSDIYQ